MYITQKYNINYLIAKNKNLQIIIWILQVADIIYGVEDKIGIKNKEPEPIKTLEEKKDVPKLETNSDL